MGSKAKSRKKRKTRKKPSKKAKRIIKIGKKAIAIETVGYLVIAVIALILLWLFLRAVAKDVTDSIIKFVTGIVCVLCDELLGIFQWIIPGCRKCP